MPKTKIEWTDFSWSPVTGCTPISFGCDHCYARRMSRRLAGRHGYPEYPNQFDVTFHPDRLDHPLRWKKPRRIFVCSMSDLFHPQVELDWQMQVFQIICKCPQHTFQILTKRPEQILMLRDCTGWIPPDNVWLGVTAENQKQWDVRVGILRQIPTAIRFVSIEPMLSEIDMHMISAGFDETGSQPEKQRTISQVILGAETGPGARPMDLNWARSIRNQCIASGVPFFFKRDSNGSQMLDGKVWHQFPEVKNGHQN